MAPKRRGNTLKFKMIIFSKNKCYMRNHLRLAYIASLSTLLIACGGGNDGAASTAQATPATPTSPATYSLNATVTGLVGTLILQNNGTDNLSINVNGSASFASQLASGSTYLITIKAQPSESTCIVSNGNGTISSTNIINIALTCTLNQTSTGGGGDSSGSGGNSGGSGGSGNIVSGVVIDGYLSNAKVFLDINKNGAFDSGEPSTTTDSNGKYSLAATPAQLASAPLVVTVEAGTATDQDDPGTAIPYTYALSAPIGSTIITPLTTHIKSKIDTGLSVATATQNLKTQLGLVGVDVTADYVATINSDAHNIAAALVPVMQAIKDTASYKSFSYSESQTLLDRNIQSILPSQVAALKSELNPKNASILIKNKVLKVIPTFSCNAPFLQASNTLPSGQGNAVFSLGNVGGTFTVPSGKTLLKQVSLNVNDQQDATYFEIKIFQWTGSYNGSIAGAALFSGGPIYFVNPNPNTSSPRIGWKPTAFNVNIAVVSGQQYLIQLLGGGGVTGTGAGVAVDDPSGAERFYLGGTVFSTFALAADFCYN